MKIKNETELNDGKVAVDICMCKTPKSNCKPEERPRKIFKSKETMEKWIKSFNVKRK